ncbi:MAG: Hsp20/alpha crystallin family protein [bacterium]|nr:Hsp20/alpha crystallin family protein [bacterium]
MFKKIIVYSVLGIGLFILATEIFAVQYDKKQLSAFEKEVQNDFSDPFFKNIHGPATEEKHVQHMIKFPKIRLLKRSNEDILQFITPGMAKKDIHIDIKGNIMTVSGKSNINMLDDISDKVELTTGFDQKVQIPDDVNVNKITSDYKEGLLTITLPKNTLKAKKINKTISID